MTGSFLHEPLLSPRVQALYDDVPPISRRSAMPGSMTGRSSAGL